MIVYSFRFLTWFLNFLGHILLITPLISLFGWVPIYNKIINVSPKTIELIYALIWSTLIYLTIISFIWVKFKPYFSLSMLSFAGGAMIMLFEYN